MNTRDRAGASLSFGQMNAYSERIKMGSTIAPVVKMKETCKISFKLFLIRRENGYCLHFKIKKKKSSTEQLTGDVSLDLWRSTSFSGSKVLVLKFFFLSSGSKVLVLKF